MIKITENREDIIALWKEAFGDSEEEIAFFIENVNDAECLAYYVDGEIASMMYLVKCRIKSAESYYIYAACTAEKHREKGLMSKLIDFAEKEYPSLCLIPANDGLIDYYSQRGLSRIIKIEDISFEQTQEIEEYLFEGYELTKPLALMFGGNSYDL